MTRPAVSRSDHAMSIPAGVKDTTGRALFPHRCLAKPHFHLL
jgi:hypothetical protein